MRNLRCLTFAALLFAAASASAQTAGGPDRATPGATPSDTPLTSSGIPRLTAATLATPGSIGANKPARPRRVRHRAPAAPASQ